MFFEHNDTDYVFVQLDNEIKYKAERLYDNFIEDHKYQYEWNLSNINKLTNYLKIWTPEDDQHLTSIEKTLDTLKLNLYTNRLNTEKTKNTKLQINIKKKNIHTLLTKKHSMDYLTLEHGANMIKNEFIIINSLFYENSNQKVFSDLNDTSYDQFIELSSVVSDSFISIPTYKLIARSEHWKSIWNSNKNKLFDKSSYDLSDEQKTLINISNMYDRIYEHPEAPSEQVIEDDDMLDGWMIYQKNKTEKNKKQSEASELNNKHPNAKEIFVVTDQKDSENISQLNSMQSTMILKDRKKALLQNKDVDDCNLPDVQREILNKMNSKR
jgi:hypothetical protein